MGKALYKCLAFVIPVLPVFTDYLPANESAPLATADLAADGCQRGGFVPKQPRLMWWPGKMGCGKICIQSPSF